MKHIILLLSVLVLVSCASSSNMPIGLPEAVSEINIYSIVSRWEIDKFEKARNINRDELEEYDGDYVLSKGSLLRTSEIIQIINNGLGEPSWIAACFEPRHIIEYESVYGKVIAQLCFECSKTYVSIDDWGKMFYHTESFRVKVEEIYKSIGVELPVEHKL